jgi:hypothetical protein
MGRQSPPLVWREVRRVTLVAVIDNAAGKFLCWVFTPQEDVESYLTCLRQIVREKRNSLGPVRGAALI